MRKLILTIAAMSFPAAAQTQVDLRTQGKDVDFTKASETKSLKTGTSVPPTCVQGDLYFLLSAPAGANVFACVATNTWAVQGGSNVPSVVNNAGTVLSTDGNILQWATFGGDITGAPGSVTVGAIQNRSVSSTAPQSGEALVWNAIASAWQPQTVAGGQGLVTLENNGTVVGARSTENFVPAFGILTVATDTGSQLNIQQSIDPAVVQTLAGDQAGSTLLCSSASGSSATYTCSMNPTLTVYTTGMALRWKPDVSGVGGPTTLNIDTIGAKSVKLSDGVTDPTSTHILIGNLYDIWYDGTVFRLQVPVINPAAIQTLAGDQAGATLLCSSASGSSATYTCSMNPTLTAYTTGMALRWKPDISGVGGPTTLNIDPIGAKSVKLSDGVTDPTSTHILIGNLYDIWYDGTVFRLQVPVINPAAIQTLAGDQAGATLLCSSASSSSAAYTCSMSPTLTVYTTGMTLHWKPDVTGVGGPTTLNIDTVGVKSVKLSDGVTDPTSADILASKLYDIWYDGTIFRLQVPAVIVGVAAAVQPACSAAVRGRLWQIFSAAGVKDQVAVCAKDATDVYAWRVIY